jgi:hypothetical protein
MKISTRNINQCSQSSSLTPSRHSSAITETLQMNSYRMSPPEDRPAQSSESDGSSIDGYAVPSKIGVSLTPSAKLPKLMDTLLGGLQPAEREAYR